MNNNMALKPVLADIAWNAEGASKWLRLAALALAGTALLTISAKIKVPMWPVEMTMQTFVVLGLGMAYGARLGAATVLLYLAQGAAMLPVFTGTPEKGIGLAYMMGPTGGYLLGFVAAAWLVGSLAERGWDRSVVKTAAAMLVGNVLIYVPGILWLGTLLGWDKPILEWGLYPFLVGDAVKLALAAAVLPLLWTIVSRIKGKS